MTRRPWNAGERPSGAAPDDSLTLLAEQDGRLIKILNGWDTTTPPPDVDDTTTVVRAAFARGSYGKLLIEHAALRVAAQTDVARVLYDIGADGLADELARHLSEFRTILDRLDELARGVDPMGLAASLPFAGAVGQLAALIRADLDVEPARTLPRLADALGDRRSRLHSDRWVRQHAPTHPAPTLRWYARIPAVVRIQARYDHLRGFPWASDAPMGDRKVVDAIDSDR